MIIFGTSEYCAWYPCYDVVYDREFLWWNGLNRMKISKNTRILDPGFRRICRILSIFFRNFGLVKDRIESDVKEGHKHISHNRNNWCIFIILARIWNQRKSGWNPGTCLVLSSITVRWLHYHAYSILGFGIEAEVPHTWHSKMHPAQGALHRTQSLGHR